MDGSETSVSYQNENSTSTTGASAMNAGENPRPMYTVPGILHFLQHEWTRFEIERQQWETERAELQARIAFLQGERQGQENLKNALVRRIKMLEYALKQERLKFNKLKYGSETAPSEDPKSSSNEGPPIFDDDENKDDSNLAFGSSSVSFKQGRQLLRQYLKEIGYVDTIIDLRSTAVKKLLGLKNESTLNGPLPLNGETESKRVLPNAASHDFDKSLASLVAFKDDQIDDESNDDEIDTNRILIKSNHDLESEEAALHEFDFLSGESAPSSSTDSSTSEWNVDPTRINRLKEEYKRERQAKPIQHSTTITNATSASIRNSLLNNGSSADDEQIYSMMFENSKNFIGDNTIEGLDELARETVSNDNEAQDDSTAGGESSTSRKTWNVKYVLRSHLDSVRCVAFHPVDSLVITASEDRTLKLWNLEKAAILRKSTAASQDLEPIYTFRRHTGPVLSLAMNPSGEQFYSGGLDSLITVWNLPSPEVDPFDAYDANVISRVFTGHTDAVWQLVTSGQKVLSCSADGSVRLWDPNLAEPLQSTYTNDGIPISIDWLMRDTNQFVATFDTLKTVLFDTETGKVVRELSNEDSSRANRVISHPSQPLLITGHDDRTIRFFDSHSGRMVHSMVAHLEAVSCLAIDAQQSCLASGSHDRSVRLWDLEQKNCLQELTVHQKKDDEAIHDVIFHSSKPFLASVGGDSIAKIYA